MGKANPEVQSRWIRLVAEQGESGETVEPIEDAFEAAMRWWGGRPNFPANTVVRVAGFPLLAHVLVMIDAVAVVPG